MRKLFFFTTTGIILFALTAAKSVAQTDKSTKQMEESKEIVVLLQTTMGDIKLKLYNETPLHRDNFVKLVESGYYDGLLFHRVIKGFMIQGGDPNSRNAQPEQMLGNGGPGYTIPAEIKVSSQFAHKNGNLAATTEDNVNSSDSRFTHKKGSLAAARTGDQVNPERESSGSQFYIVHNDNGTPHLDGAYTVYGETIEGFDVIDKIATVKTGAADRPVEDVKIIKASIVK
jgi:peptidyl-prolyl cis-trans isomerase B (cyclophilin B)